MKVAEFVILFIAIPGFIGAQSHDYSIRAERLNEQVAELNKISDSIFNIHDDLFNGKLYISDADRINHPFFIENTWMPGTVYYSGTFSDGKIVKYDLVTDNLVIMLKREGISFPVCINRDVIQGFIISGHRFIMLDDPQKKQSDELTTGYYEILYDGPTGFFIRWTKTRTVNKNTMQTEYPLEAKYCLKMDGEYHLIRNNSSFIKVLGDHKEEVSSFMKIYRLRFSPGKIENAVKVLEFYDSL